MRLIIAFILFPVILCAQINKRTILGGWVKTKAEMKDGSRIVERNSTRTGFLLYAFGENDDVYFGTDPLINQFHFTYKIKDSIIDIAQTSYQIIKLTKDSLILQDINPNLNDDKLARFYFVKLETHHNDQKQVYDSVVRDSVYNITNFIFPQSIGATNQVTNSLRGISASGRLKLSFVITKHGNIADIRLLENDSLSKSTADRIVDELENTRDSWYPGSVNGKPVNIALQMTVEIKKDSKYIGFITPFTPSGNLYKGLPMQDIIKEQAAFNEGIDFSKKHDFVKALDAFTRCLQTDEINLDAYYFRAAIFFQTGNKKAACDDWSKLSQLGQVLATKYLMKYCKN
jgi:hypothetical protein